MSKPAPALDMSWDELGELLEGLSFASRPFHEAIRNITDEYDLGPRGAWIIAVIAPGYIRYPLEIAELFRVGRSLITAELTRLSDAGLITGTQNSSDRRRTELEVTAEGAAVFERIKQVLRGLVADRLGGYSREELLLCARMLTDFRKAP